MGDKSPYQPHEAAARIASHAEHFVGLLHEALADALAHPELDPDGRPIPPVLCAPFDAELFGHWWFEGPQWLEQVARLLHAGTTASSLTSVRPSTSNAFRAPRPSSLEEGSWGAEGSNQVWLNPETAWTYSHIYPAELFTREVCTEWASGSMKPDRDLGDRILQPALPRAAAARILRLAVPDHYRRRPRLRRAALLDP